MCLPGGGLGYSSERVHFNGFAYQLVAGALEGFCKKNGQGGFARDFQVAQAHQLVSTPVQVHPLRTVSKPTNSQAHPELYPSPPTSKHTRSSAPAQNCVQELYPSPPTGKHTRSSAPAQNCIQAHQLVSTPIQAHPLRTVSKPTNW